MIENFKRSRLFHFLDWALGVLLMAIILVAVVMLLTAVGSAQVRPQVFVDNVNGSTPSSGSPESVSPVIGLATCHTNGAASTTIQWPANGLTAAGVPSDGSAVAWLNTGAGRQYTRITAIAAGTITVANSFNIALASAVDCAVGGRLLNVTPRLALDMDSGNVQTAWQINIVNSGLTYTWTASIVAPTTNGCGFVGVKDGSGVRPTVSCDFQPGTCLTSNACDVISLEIQNSNATKTGTVAINQSDLATVRDNIIGGPTAALSFATGITGAATNRRSTLANLIRNNLVGLNATGTDFTWIVAGNVFQTNERGIQMVTTANSFFIYANIFWENSIAGIDSAQATLNYYNAILFNTFDLNATAVNFTNLGAIQSLLFASNLITNNTTGVAYSGAATDIERESALVDSNCYGTGAAANGANVSGFILGTNVINVDPQYVNEVTGDFTPLNRAVNFIAWPPGLESGVQKFYPGTTTASQVRCGAIQGGGVGGFANVGI